MPPRGAGQARLAPRRRVGVRGRVLRDHAGRRARGDELLRHVPPLPAGQARDLGLPESRLLGAGRRRGDLLPGEEARLRGRRLVGRRRVPSHDVRVPGRLHRGAARRGRLVLLPQRRRRQGGEDRRRHQGGDQAGPGAAPRGAGASQGGGDLPDAADARHRPHRRGHHRRVRADRRLRVAQEGARHGPRRRDRHGQEVGSARARRRRLPDRRQVELHAEGLGQAALRGGQRRRVGAGHLQGPDPDGAGSPLADRREPRSPPTRSRRRGSTSTSAASTSTRRR